MKTYIAVVAFTLMPVVALAQGYYDDDLYYNPDNDTKTSVKKKTTAPVRQTAPLSYSHTTVPASDTYDVNTGSTLDVDEYNRHGAFLVSDSVPFDSITPDLFSNTRRIERFHNADIISGSDNNDLATYYYSQQPQTDVNIYVVNPSPWYWRYGSPWYDWTWNYGWSVYDPWYAWSWGPSFSWSWSWGPSWYPGYYPGWYPGWYPGCHPGHYPGWCGPSWSWHPNTGVGSSRPMPPTSGGGAYRPGQNGFHPGQATTSGTSRPGNMGRGRVGTTVSNGRYTSGSHSTGSSSSGNYNTGSQNNSRGRNSHYNSTTTYPSRSSSSSSSGFGRGSSGSFGSGRSSGGSHGGGSFGRGRR